MGMRRFWRVTFSVFSHCPLFGTLPYRKHDLSVDKHLAELNVYSHKICHPENICDDNVSFFTDLLLYDALTDAGFPSRTHHAQLEAANIQMYKVLAPNDDDDDDDADTAFPLEDVFCAFWTTPHLLSRN